MPVEFLHRRGSAISEATSVALGRNQQFRLCDGVVKKLCGWTRSAMLSRYDITSERDVNDAVAKLANATREPSKVVRMGGS